MVEVWEDLGSRRSLGSRMRSAGNQQGRGRSEESCQRRDDFCIWEHRNLKLLGGQGWVGGGNRPFLKSAVLGGLA